MKDKVLGFIKKYRYLLIGAACALAVLILIIALVSGSSDSNEAAAEWGEGITEGIPEFPQEYTSHTGGKGYTAFYYENVTSEQVQTYTALIESECNTEFSSDKYPRSAKYGEKMIVIHYNVTEMKMSVTVTVNSTESTHSGEQQ